MAAFLVGRYRLAVMRLVNLAEYELRARDIAEGATLDYYDGGSNDEVTLRENVAAFSRISLYPRVFRGVGQRDTQTSALGLSTSTPVMIARVALIGILHPDGDVPVVRAASNAGAIVTPSTFSVTSIEDVVAAATGAVWFQLYVYRDRSASEALVRRVEAAGCTALELTADAPSSAAVSATSATTSLYLKTSGYRISPRTGSFPCRNRRVPAGLRSRTRSTRSLIRT
jgi:isopentenyl diphosphate isomerase/L-lactate dehydrogenase-like FMN-dependent dehydrogenase